MAGIESGEVLDGFQVGQKLHTGGMARIHRVTHPEIAAPMVMKSPKLSEGEDPAAIVSFEMEQMILPRLSGSHCPRVYAVGDFTAKPYIVMEHIQGESLFATLEHLPQPAETVALLGAKIAQALDSLHRQNVIHLDLKPSNVMLRETGEAVLIDFGLAHHTDLPDLMREEFRLPYGTAPYMAPEQVLGVRNYRRSDLFALGVLMYFFATGARPFGDPQSLQGLKRRLWEDADPPRKVNPNVPPWLQEVILRCLEADPENRYPTAAQVAFDLQHPGQVALSARAAKMDRDPWLTRANRRRRQEKAAPVQKLASQSMFAQAPIVAVAVDLGDGSSGLHDALRAEAKRILGALPLARLACLNVLKLRTMQADQTLDDDGQNKHLQRLIELKRWAEPLKLPAGKVTFHVLEAVKPAEAILEYARANHVDHIVMGARSESAVRRLLGSVSAEVAAHAPCTVTVARRREWKAADPAGTAAAVAQSADAE
jgi:eukaryotic-like serine/threonine-protein kinase